MHASRLSVVSRYNSPIEAIIRKCKYFNLSHLPLVSSKKQFRLEKEDVYTLVNVVPIQKNASLLPMLLSGGKFIYLKTA